MYTAISPGTPSTPTVAAVSALNGRQWASERKATTAAPAISLTATPKIPLVQANTRARTAHAAAPHKNNKTVSI